MSDDWMARAACRPGSGIDPNIFFPERGGDVMAARLVCESCPVMNDCLIYAMTLPEAVSGIWGGTSERERGRTPRRGGTSGVVAAVGHGSNSGYQRHLRMGTATCAACRSAHSEYVQAHKKPSVNA